MLRDIIYNFSPAERAQLCELIGTSEETLQTKYLSPDPHQRSIPRRGRFEEILAAINTVRPSAVTRAQLAAYFYAAPAGTGRTGQNKPEAA